MNLSLIIHIRLLEIVPAMILLSSPLRPPPWYFFFPLCISFWLFSVFGVFFIISVALFALSLSSACAQAVSSYLRDQYSAKDVLCRSLELPSSLCYSLLWSLCPVKSYCLGFSQLPASPPSSGRLNLQLWSHSLCCKLEIQVRAIRRFTSFLYLLLDHYPEAWCLKNTVSYVVL